MYSIFLISLLAVLFAYLANNKMLKYGLEWSFVLLTVFLAIRYDFGNDYNHYLRWYKQYQSLGVGLLQFDRYDMLRDYEEYGWIFLNLLFARAELGFFSLVMVLTIFENIVIYRFIKLHVNREWYWLAVFIFTFNAGLMLVGASMIRQWFALCLFLLGVEFIIAKKTIPYVLVVFAAAQIHSSAWVLLLAYFVRFIPTQFSKSFFLISIPIYLLWLYFAPSLLGNNLELILQSREIERYSIYLSDEKASISIIGYITTYLFPILCFSCINKVNNNLKIIFLLYAFYIFILPLVEVTPQIGRIGTYFSILFICVLPGVMNSLKASKNQLYLPLLIVYLMLTLYNYFPFFSSSTFGEHYQNYQTIFSQPWQ